MKRFLFQYWDGEQVARWYTKVKSEEEAKAKFRKLKGDKTVLSIEEVTKDRPQYRK